MQAALDVPACDGLEFDVRVSLDGAPVLLHDATLERVQGRPDGVDELSAAELRELGVPLLGDVLAAIPHDTFLDVELKGDPGPHFVEILERARGIDGRLHSAVVSSFDPEPLASIGAARPSWGRWLNAWDMAPGTLDLACSIGCQAIAAHWRVIDERAVALAHAADLDVAAFTVRRRSTFDRLSRLGVVAMCVEAAALDG
jgi:glycerophosphoryl diester phosphodiesterase